MVLVRILRLGVVRTPPIETNSCWGGEHERGHNASEADPGVKCRLVPIQFSLPRVPRHISSHGPRQTAGKMPREPRELQYFKCHKCREDKQKVSVSSSTARIEFTILISPDQCLPTARQWPSQRCDRCIKYNRPCSENTSLPGSPRRRYRDPIATNMISRRGPDFDSTIDPKPGQFHFDHEESSPTQHAEHLLFHPYDPRRFGFGIMDPLTIDPAILVPPTSCHDHPGFSEYLEASQRPTLTEQVGASNLETEAIRVTDQQQDPQK